MEAKLEQINTKLQQIEQGSSAQQEEAAKSLLPEVPALETCSDSASKVQVLVLRGKIKLLIPSLEKEAEADVSKALKLNAKDKNAWLAMSEILWTRRAHREARDAAESAVRAAPNDVSALCQASRLARVVSMNEKNAEKKPALISASIQRAKQALALNPQSSESWLALALSLFHECCVNTMTFSSFKKALAAIIQSCRCNPTNADAWVNRGLIEHAMCQFGDSLISFEIAAKHDSVLKPQTDAASKRSMGMLMLLQQRVRLPLEDRPKHISEWKDVVKALNAGSLESKEKEKDSENFTSLAQLASASNSSGKEEGEKKSKSLVVAVLRLVSGASDMPLVYEAIDRDKNLCALSISNMHPQAIPLSTTSTTTNANTSTTAATTTAAASSSAAGGNNLVKPVAVTILIPPGEVTFVTQAPSAQHTAATTTAAATNNKESAATTTTTKAQQALEKVSGGLQPLHCVFCDAKSILINGADIPAKHVVAAAVSVTNL